MICFGFNCLSETESPRLLVTLPMLVSTLCLLWALELERKTNVVRLTYMAFTCKWIPASFLPETLAFSKGC
jgi:hypothetical protein